MKRPGFTLIELTAVMALIALLVGVAVVQLREPYRQAMWETALERIAELDHFARVQAEQSGQNGSVIVRPGTGLIDVRLGKDLRQQLDVSAVARVQRVYVAGQAGNGETVEIPVSTWGQTPSYALQMQGAAGQERWLLLIGLTGQRANLDHDGFLSVQRAFLAP